MNTFTYNSKTYTVSNGTLFEVVRSRRFKGLMAVNTMDTTLMVRAWMSGMKPQHSYFNRFFTPNRNN